MEWLRGLSTPELLSTESSDPVEMGGEATAEGVVKRVWSSSVPGIVSNLTGVYVCVHFYLHIFLL